jgi:hypothetical protein
MYESDFAAATKSPKISVAFQAIPSYYYRDAAGGVLSWAQLGSAGRGSTEVHVFSFWSQAEGTVMI